MNKLYSEFEEWFHQLDGFETRSERCYDEYEATKNLHPFKNMRRWLEAAFLAGRMQNTYALTVKEDERGLYLVLPEEMLAQTGWTEATTLEWHDNNNGSWTIKAK